MPVQLSDVKELDVTSTKLVNFFYPHGTNNKTTSLCFKPMDLIKGEVVVKYLENTSLSASDKITFINLFGKRYTTDLPENRIDTHISPTGKSENTTTMEFMEHSYQKVISLNSFVNFIYYEQGSFYCIQPSSFRSQLRTEALDTETKKIDRIVLSNLIDQIYNNEDKKVWLLMLAGMNLKSSKVTLAKILISLFPELLMPEITTLCDFIQSEILCSSGNTVVDKNVLELKGDLITFFYNVNNYKFKDDGNLGQSCMKNNCNTEQIKFYASNPTNVSVLTYIVDKQLYARCVMWTDVHGRKSIDRLYCSSSDYATKIVSYCKQNNIGTIHSQTAEMYGMPHIRDCVVKLDTYAMPLNQYPYLDSMCAIEVIGGYISTDTSRLYEYMDTTDLDYIIKNLYRNGTMGLQAGYNDPDVRIRKNGTKLDSLKFPIDAMGNKISSNLNNYALVKKPKLSLLRRNEIVTVGKGEKVSGEWCENVLIKKYNSIRPTLLFIKGINRFVVYYYDKQDVEYSTYHQLYIRKQDAVYVDYLKTYVIKDVMYTTDFKNTLKLLRLRKLYGGKLVSITPEALIELREQLKLLPFRESLMDIRKSRVYNINVKNILPEGIRIKGIVIPFKQLRFVKHESN